MLWVLELISSEEARKDGADTSQVVGIFTTIEKLQEYITGEKVSWPKEEDAKGTYLRAIPHIEDNPNSHDPRLTVWTGWYKGTNTAVTTSRYFELTGEERIMPQWWLEDIEV